MPGDLEFQWEYSQDATFARRAPFSRDLSWSDAMWSAHLTNIQSPHKTTLCISVNLKEREHTILLTCPWLYEAVAKLSPKFGLQTQSSVTASNKNFGFSKFEILSVQMQQIRQEENEQKILMSKALHGQSVRLIYKLKRSNWYIL